MPRDGSGVFTPLYDWETDADAGTPFSPTRWKAQDEDFADALNDLPLASIVPTFVDHATDPTTLNEGSFAYDSGTFYMVVEIAGQKQWVDVTTGTPPDLTDYVNKNNNLSDLANAATARTNLGVAIGTNVQAYDADLSAVAGLSSAGFIARTGAGTAAARTLTAPAAGITVTNGDGVSGNPTLALANDLAAVEGLSGTGLIRRTASDTWSAGTTVATAEITDAAVTTAKIADSNVTTAKIADANITTAKILDANVTAAKLASDAVTTAKILDANVTTAKIADDAVTYDKLQNASATARILGRKTAGSGNFEECTLSEVLDLIGSAAQGDMLYRGSSGWSRLVAGSSGYYLKTNGSGADPAWSAGPTSDMVLLTSGTVSAAATLDIVLTGYTSYRTLQIVLSNFRPVTDGATWRMRVSTNGGSSYDAGASDYKHSSVFVSSDATGGYGRSSDADTGVTLADGVGNGSSEGASALITILDQTNTAMKPKFFWQSTSYRSSDLCDVTAGSGIRNAAQDTDAVRFLFSSGNITSGAYAVYGLR